MDIELKEDTYMKVYCCLDHVDVALDTIVDETGEPPFINEKGKVEPNENEANKVGATCEYCGKPSVYIVAN